MNKEERKERHKLAMREYRKTEKYRLYDRRYATIYRKSKNGKRVKADFSIKTEPLSIAKEVDYHVP